MPKILVIEDAKALINAWIGKFRNHGFEVLTAQNEKTAIQTAVQTHPDLVVVDLPDTEGMAVVKKLREQKWAVTVPIMFLNSWHDPELLMEHSEGIDDYLAYNWSLEEVVQKAKRKLALV